MKKTALLLFVIYFCLLSACGSQKEVSGKIVEVSMEEEIGVVSFVVQTGADEAVGLFLTDETAIFSLVEGITDDEFRAGSFRDIIVSVECENTRNSLNTQNNKKIIAYHAKQILITEFSTGK